MSSKDKQANEGQAAVFTCGSCESEFPAEGVGKKDEQGRPLCIPCSLKMTSTAAAATTKESHEEHKARVEASHEKREKDKGSRRLVAVLLLLAIPIIALEGLLLLKNRQAELTAAEVADIELSECMIMMTVLGQYYDEHGEYPPDLDALVPDFWRSSDAAELQRYQYSRIGIDNFRLERSSSALPAALISEALDRDLLPAAMTCDTDMDSYLDRVGGAD